MEGVYERNPYISDYPGRLAHELSGNGVQVSSLTSARPYLHFRLRVPEFTAEEWDNTREYSEDDLVFFGDPENEEATGECYQSLQDSNTDKQPDTETTYWERVEFPAFLGEFVTQAVYAELMKGDSQQKLGAEASAWSKLANAGIVWTEQQGQYDRADVAGY